MWVSLAFNGTRDGFGDGDCLPNHYGRASHPAHRRVHTGGRDGHQALMSWRTNSSQAPVMSVDRARSTYCRDPV